MDLFGTLAGGGAMMLAVIATAAVIARHSNFYRREPAGSGNRGLALDGLRGFAGRLGGADGGGTSRRPLDHMAGNRPLGRCPLAGAAIVRAGRRDYFLHAHRVSLLGQSPRQERKNARLEIMAWPIIPHRPAVSVQPAPRAAGGGRANGRPLAGAGELETPAPSARAGSLEMARHRAGEPGRVERRRRLDALV